MKDINSNQTHPKWPRSPLLEAPFLDKLSHELRTPLNTILGFSEILQSGGSGNLSPKQKNYCKAIYSDGRELLSLINDVIELLKLEASVLKLDLAPANIAELLEQVRSAIQMEPCQHMLECMFDKLPMATLFTLDEAKVKTMLLHLIFHALKRTPPRGRITLSASLHETDLLEISIHDTGPNMAADQIEQLFKPFSRIQAEHSKSRGTGLELFIVARLVSLHAGSIAIRSQPEKGNTVYLTLPRLPMPSEKHSDR